MLKSTVISEKLSSWSPMTQAWREPPPILRIEDGVIKTALAPSEVIAQEKAVSYVDQIKDRINEINMQMQQLDSDFRSEQIDGDEYVQKHQTLKNIRDSLKEELSRMGVIPP